MKFLLFASALAVLSSAAAHDDRRRTSTGTIHFSEQVDGALKLIQKGTNSKVDGSPIQQLIYKEESSGGGGDDKGRKDDDNDDNDSKGGDKKDDDDGNDRKGGGNKDSSSSNDRKGGPSSSSSSSNDRKGGGSSSSSSGDARAIDNICNLGHNACDHDNENKGKKGTSDDLAFKIECDIACSTSLCSHDNRENMGCPPTLSSTAKFVQKGAEFNTAASPIQQLIYKEEEEGGSDGSGDTKDDKDDEDRKGGGDNKDSSSSNDRKGGPSSSSSNDRKGGPSSSSSSGDNGPSNDGFCDLDCGPDNLTSELQELCNVACKPDSMICTDDEQDKMNCPGTSGDDERAWKKNLRRRNRKND